MPWPAASPSVNVNPGSGNPIGGLAIAMHTHGRYIEEMVLRSPSGLKSALGENPKRVYGDKKQTPSTRLGTAMVIRKAFIDAQNYMAKDDPNARDPRLEALAMVLRREIPWRQHCHRADDVATALRLADEFGYELVLDHGTEAHVLADVLAERGVPVLIGPLFTTKSKVELRGRSLANPGKLAAAGVEISIITDHPVIPINFLVHQCTLAVKEGLDRGNGAAGHHHQSGQGAGSGRPDRVHRQGQGRGSGALERRSAGRDAARPEGVDRRQGGLPLRRRVPAGAFRQSVSAGLLG